MFNKELERAGRFYHLNWQGYKFPDTKLYGFTKAELTTTNKLCVYIAFLRHRHTASSQGKDKDNFFFETFLIIYLAVLRRYYQESEKEHAELNENNIQVSLVKSKRKLLIASLQKVNAKSWKEKPNPKEGLQGVFFVFPFPFC